VDIVVLDDYSDRENTLNPLQREKTWSWVQENVLTRLNPDRGRLIVIQTRWAEDDIVGHLEKIGAKPLCYPALKDGESLWPEKWTREGLEQRRRDMGSSLFDRHYQGIVRPPEGNIFKREWWKDWSAADGLPTTRQIVISLHTAFKTDQDRDYSVATVWALCRSGHYLLNMWRERVEFPQLIKAVKQLSNQWEPRYVLIEDAGSGTSLIQQLKHDTGLNVVPVRVVRDKQERAAAVTAEIEVSQGPKKHPSAEGHHSRTRWHRRQ